MSGAADTREKHRLKQTNFRKTRNSERGAAFLSSLGQKNKKRLVWFSEVRKFFFFIRPVRFAPLRVGNSAWGGDRLFYYNIVSVSCVVGLRVCSSRLLNHPFLFYRGSLYFRGFLIHCEGSWVWGGACSQSNENQMLPSLPGMPLSLQTQRKTQSTTAGHWLTDLQLPTLTVI